MTLKVKIATALVAGSFLAATVLPAAAFAKTSITISGNGKNSKNTTTVKNTTSSKLTQTNFTLVGTGVLSLVGTGGNKANGNTGGDTTVKSGDGTSTVTVNNPTVTNNNAGPQCPCNFGKTDVTISGNGENSNNDVTVTNSSSSTTTQSDKTIIVTLVGSVVGTGGNAANGNTGGDTEVTSGDGTSTVTVDTTTPTP